MTTSINLADFGYFGDGVHDDTEAWRRGIAAATAARVRKIIVPWGRYGVSLVEGQIVNGPLASTLTFEGVGSGETNYNFAGPRLKYTGGGTCWFINHEQFLGSEGRWTWRNLAFETTDGEATMFDFNDVLNPQHETDFAGPQPLPAPPFVNKYSFLEHVRFENCYFAGANQAEAQTGDAIRGAKMFQLVIDENCYFTGWRRAVWLYGCDNCTLKMRAYLNMRNLMLEGAFSYGNDTLVESRYLGASPYAPSEDNYLVWDSAHSTTYLGCYLEYGAAANAPKALLYINGMNTAFLSPHFGIDLRSTVPLFHLGADAREILMLHPKLPGAAVPELDQEDPLPTLPAGDWTPTIDAPTSTQLGHALGGHYMLIVGANVNFQTTVGVHPRLRWVGAQRGRDTSIDQSREMLADASGYRPRQSVLSALNFWDGPYGTPVSAGVSLFVDDEDASHGWAMRCAYDVAQSGLYPEFLIGRDFMPGDQIRLSLRAKTADPTNWYFAVLQDGAPIGPAASLTTLGSSFTYIEATLDLSGFTAGQKLGLAIYQAGVVTAHLDVDYLALDVVSPSPAIDAPAGGGTQDAQAREAIASILALLEAQRLMA